MTNERDAAAQRHQATVEKEEKFAILVHDEEVNAVLDLVEKIGVTLSSRK
jgi:anaphase-promoting complex subunit 5